MSTALLTFLRYVFLAMLYLFFVRVLRAVWTELREPKVVAGAPLVPASGVGTGRRAKRARAEQLVVLEPPDRQGQLYDLGDELTIGRAAGCGVTLPDDTFVSQLHARVFRHDGDFAVEDLGSTNGTYLNGKKVSAAVPLRKGDRLQVGKTVMELAK